MSRQVHIIMSVSVGGEPPTIGATIHLTQAEARCFSDPTWGPMSNTGGAKRRARDRAALKIKDVLREVLKDE